MIPTFPFFKNLEKSDKNLFMSLTNSYAPYAEYNFLNLWSWDINNKAKFSILNDNLVIQFTDYITQEPYYSFLGIKNNKDTVKNLLKFISSEGLTPELRLVPEICIIGLNKDKELIVKETPDHFDYILSVEILKNYPGSRMANKRNHVKNFKKEFQPNVKQLDLADKKTREEIVSVFNGWANFHDNEGSTNEKNALNKFLESAGEFNMLTVGVYIEDKLQAFWAHEILDHSCTISHFEKANSGISTGLYSFLMQETAKLLSKREIYFINFEQDLGIPQLREGKKGYLPHEFLRKYSVSYF